MHPVNGTNRLLRLDKNGRLKTLLLHEMAPRIDEPTEQELDALVTYWGAVLNHVDAIETIQKYDPNYMPPFELVEIINGELKITVLTN